MLKKLIVLAGLIFSLSSSIVSAAPPCGPTPPCYPCDGGGGN